MRTEDGQIIHKCLSGESEAFGFLVDKYKESVYGFAYAKLLNFHDAEDVTQEVFIRAYQKLRSLRRWDNFHAWIYSITSNLCKMWLRARSRRPDGEFIADQKPEVQDIRSIGFYHENLVNESLNESLKEALESLPEMYRQVLILYYLSDMNYREIAKFLGASPAAILQRLRRARLQMKEEMFAMMTKSFGTQKIPDGFTFRILEAVKRIKIQPISRAPGLPWGISLATGIIIAMLSIGSNISMTNPAISSMSSSLSTEGKALRSEEISVDILETSEISIAASNQGSGGGRISDLPDPLNTALMMAHGGGDTWSEKADMPTARFSLSTCVLNGNIYAIGGWQAFLPDAKVAAVEEYNPVTDTWTSKSSMPTPRQGLSVSMAGGKIYAMGGWTIVPDEICTIVEEYNPATDTWTRKADMSVERVFFPSITVNGKIYAIGGAGGISMVEEYDPTTDTWTRKSDIPTARGYVSASLADGRIYVMGGATAWGSIPLSIVEVYDPVADTWTRVTDIPTARIFLSTSAVGDKIYAIGGAVNWDFAPTSTVEEYDVATDTWTSKNDIPTARSFLSTSAVNGKIYAIGGTKGKDGMPISTVEEYDTGFVPQEVSSMRTKKQLTTVWGKIKSE